MIATAYVGWIAESYVDRLRPVVCADADPGRARAFAGRFGLQPTDNVADLLARDDIELVLNLTNPVAHEDVTLAALRAGKHVFSEKPLAMTLDGADRILRAAAQAHRLVACAPCIALGAAQRTAWQWVREGRLGAIHEVVLAVSTAGHEHWHPDPRYYYQPGAGPVLDLGVYPLTLATTILGPVSRAWGLADIAIPEREVATGPLAGTRFSVAIPDQVVGMLRFECGTLGTLHASFANAHTDIPAVELHGSLGSLNIGDFHRFDARIKVCMRGESAWHDLPLPGPQVAPNWARAKVDLADAAVEGLRPRLAADHAAHVLEVMIAIERSASLGGMPVAIERRFSTPMPLDEQPLD
jgi:predicted dehydrogenase